MALDPGIVVIGGGLMDHEATTPEFRERYMRVIRETAVPYFWAPQRAPSRSCRRNWANSPRPSGGTGGVLIIKAGH